MSHQPVLLRPSHIYQIHKMVSDLTDSFKIIYAVIFFINDGHCTYLWEQSLQSVHGVSSEHVKAISQFSPVRPGPQMQAKLYVELAEKFTKLIRSDTVMSAK